MEFYSTMVLIVGSIAVYVGVESLALYYYSRQRLYLWLGSAGVAVACYCVASHQMYSATTVAEGARWELWQLILSGVLADVVILLGLEYLGRVRRRHILGLAAMTGVFFVLMWIPEVGLTDKPAVKELPYFGIRYLEVEIGPAPAVFMVIIVSLMATVLVLLARQAWRGSVRDRLMAGVFSFWWAAAVNDILVVAGVYQGIYLVELSFFLILVVVASMIATAEYQTRVLAEAARQQLAVEVVAKDRDLAAAHAELTEVAKLAAVGRLAAGVAHEVNNPLAYVMANLQILVDELRGELATVAGEALEGARRIQGVVRQLLNFSRSGSGPIGQCDLARAVDAAVKMAMVELRDRARLEVDLLDAPPVQMDERPLAQVLLNLLVNASQAIPPGQRNENCVTLAVRRAQTMVEISVTDTGPGIPEEVLPHLFEPFFTTKAFGQGQGLGLAISRELVTSAGGDIVAENVEPHGARFILRLPAAPSPKAKGAPTPTTIGAAGSTVAGARTQLRMLLIDDEELVLTSFARHLGRRYQVRTATGGWAAIALLAEGEELDLVLCDMMMPNGTGLDVVRWIIDNRPPLARHTILMTGGVAEQKHEHVEQGKVFPILAKPFTVGDLDALVTRLRARA